MTRVIDEEVIFAEALARSSPTERAAYLDQACGVQGEVRREVEALLAAHEGAGAFLRSPAACVVGTADSEDVAGSVVGRYKLLERIGEGGMGVVYMAEQTDPVQRKVALKIIKPGMDTRQVIGRFEAERQALALMDHPTIAKVLDAGSTDSGRPYFVMELVRGVPITEYCDQNQLTPRQRLELFVAVCQAVQHAHGKGIIHRDLKPGNVLVTLQDGDKPTPKVIDFGIAKATAAGQRLTNRTMFTEFRQLIGTPLYMSPEQAEMSSVMDVDTRSDVYSLGVLLYELLTGTTPFDKERLAKAAYDEVRRIIREEEPPTPSTRLSELGETLTSISTQRRSDPKTLGRTIRGELDWIVMKALEKERSRRYETASGLARDVERYLAEEPVEAGPTSRTYRLRKLARRYRVPLRVAAAFALLLVAATAVSTWQAVRATRAKSTAVAAEAKALAEKKRANEQAAITKAVNDFLNQYVLGQASVYNQDAKEAAPDPDLKVREALDRAAAGIGGRFKDQPLVEAAIRHTIGDAYLDLGELEKAEQHLSTALRLRRQVLGEADLATLGSLTSLAHVYYQKGSNEKAESVLTEGLKISRPVRGLRDPATLSLLLLEARLTWAKGDYAGAARQMREVLDGRRIVLGSHDRLTLGTMSALGNMCSSLGQPAQAESLVSEAFEAQVDVLGLSHPDTCYSALVLAKLYLDTERPQKAEALLTKTSKATRQAFGTGAQTLQMLEMLGRVYADEGRLDDAVSVLQQVLDTWRERKGEHDPRTLRTMMYLGNTYFLRGQFAEAERLLAESLQGLRAVCGNRNAETIVAMSLLERFHQERGRYGEAEALSIEVVQASREVRGPEHPATLGCMNNLALLYTQQGKFDRAEPLSLQVVETSRRVLGPLHVYTLHAVFNLALLYAQMHRVADAVRLLQEEVDQTRQTLGEDNLEMALALSDLGTLKKNLGKLDEAEQHLKKALTLRRKLLGDNDADVMTNLESLVNVLEDRGRLAEAEPLLREVVEGLRKTGGTDQTHLRAALDLLATVYYRTGDDMRAAPLLREEAEWLLAQPAGGRYFDAERVLIWLANCHRTLERTAEARECEQKLRGVLEAKAVRLSAELKEAVIRPAEAAVVLHGRAATHLRLGRFDQGLDDLAKSTELDPSVEDTWTTLAYLQLYLGRDQEYLATREELLRRFGSLKTDRTAKVCLAYSKGPGDAQQVLRMVDAALATNARAYIRQFYHVAKGMAQYRSGNDAAAIEFLTRSRDEFARTIAAGRRDERDQVVWDEMSAAANYFLAIAERRQGRDAEARAALRLAREHLRRMPSIESGGVKVGMGDWLLAHIVAREAEELMGGQSPATAPASGPAAIPPATGPGTAASLSTRSSPHSTD